MVGKRNQDRGRPLTKREAAKARQVTIDADAAIEKRDAYHAELLADEVSVYAISQASGIAYRTLLYRLNKEQRDA